MVDRYSERAARRFEKEGLSGSDAVLVAATEMEGAATNPDGTVNARQTACLTLRYNENLPRDPHADLASAEQRKETAIALRLRPDASQKEVDEAIAKKYGLPR